MRFNIPRTSKPRFFESLANDLNISLSHLERHALEVTDPSDAEVLAIFRVEVVKAKINVMRRIEMLNKAIWDMERDNLQETHAYARAHGQISEAMEVEQRLSEVSELLRK